MWAPAIRSGVALALALVLAGCEGEQVDEQAFRHELAGPWVQADGDSVKPYWEFTREGTILDLDGKPIGKFASAGTYRRIQVEVQGEAPFTTDFALAARGKSLSFISTRFRPFTRADKELRNRALFELQSPLILENLEQLAAAARTIRAGGGPRKLGYADLVGPGKPISELKSIAGEDYTKLEFTGEAILRVKTSYNMELAAAD